MPSRDPVASLAPAEIIVTLAGQDFIIPAYPALNWLHALLAESLSLLEIVPGMLDPEQRIEVEE